MKKEFNQKKVIITGVLLCLCFGVFASDGITALDEWGDKILGLLTSNWLRAICALAFAIESGALIFAGRGQDGIVKKFLPWMVGTIGLLACSGIAEFFFDQV